MIFGGFTAGCGEGLCPEGAARLGGDALVWQSGGHAVRVFEVPEGGWMTVLGVCGASDAELRAIRGRVPGDATWRWAGSYAVVEQHDGDTVVHTDPAGALPLYATAYEGGWAWSNSARSLAGLVGASVDITRLATAVFLPHVPAAVGARSFFMGIRQLPPGAKITLRGGRNPRSATQWRPDPTPGPVARRLRAVLTEAVRLRAAADPQLTCDLSGGLDSSSLALLAATSLPAGKALNAVTVHADGHQHGADLTYARLAASYAGPRLTHHLLPLGTEHLPYTDITSVPPTDEPAPSTLTRARLEGQLRWMRDRLESRTHLTGDGGDSVLFVPPAHLADLLRHRHYRRAAAETAGWARLRHTAMLPLLRDARSLTGTSRTQALNALVQALGDPQACAGRSDVGWFPALPLPGWATDTTVGLLTTALHDAAVADPLPGLDIAIRILVDDIREVARSAVADTQLAATHGIALHNPFLDPRVVDTVLRTEIYARPPIHAYKPLLVRAMTSVLPDRLAARTTKGSFNADHYTGLRANLAALQDLADGRLAALGLVDPGGLRADLALAAAGLPASVASLEQALATEAWLRTLDVREATWTRLRKGDNCG